MKSLTHFCLLFFIITSPVHAAFVLSDEAPATAPKPKKQGLVLDGQAVEKPPTEKRKQTATVAAGVSNEEEKGNVLKGIARATPAPKKTMAQNKAEEPAKNAEQPKNTPTYDPNNLPRMTASEAEAFAASNPDFLDLHAEELKNGKIHSEIDFVKDLEKLPNGNKLQTFQASEPRPPVIKPAKDDKLQELSSNHLIVWGLILFFLLLIISVIMFFVNLIRINNAALALKRLKKRASKPSKYKS